MKLPYRFLRYLSIAVISMRILLLLHLFFVTYLGYIAPEGLLNDHRDVEVTMTSSSYDVPAPLDNLVAWVERGQRNLSSESEQRSTVTSFFDLDESNLEKGNREEVSRGQNHLLTVYDRVILYHQLLC
ncbi:MAG: hypothetical protein IPL46_33655 [Saprospiraceae bacterium]|nr:hypothetical protein [Saprospiraceae bacterium]